MNRTSLTPAAVGSLVAALLLAGCASSTEPAELASPTLPVVTKAAAATAPPALSDAQPDVAAAEAGYLALVTASDAAFQAGFDDPALNEVVLRLTPTGDLDHEVAGIAAMQRYGVARVGDTQVTSLRAIERGEDPSGSGGSTVRLTACVDRTATDLVFLETGVSMDTVADSQPVPSGGTRARHDAAPTGRRAAGRQGRRGTRGVVLTA